MTSGLQTSGEYLISAYRAGFPPGYTAITREGEPALDVSLDVGLDFGIHILHGGETLEYTSTKESAWVLLEGQAAVAVDGREFSVARRSLFDEAPTTVHLGPQTALQILAHSARVEWAVAGASNPHAFAPRLFWPGDIEPEYRGLGLAQGACLRNVRLVFDRRERPVSNLVVGEVVNYPGRWSSYPPHHHPQPEIYHYRFSPPQGYGHGEVGERVYKLRQYDTLRIPADHDHAQVAAPGYAMYYLWVVRHLDGRPYEGFECTAEHAWILDSQARIWEPDDVPFTGSSASGAASRPHAPRRPWIAPRPAEPPPQTAPHTEPPQLEPSQSEPLQVEPPQSADGGSGRGSEGGS